MYLSFKEDTESLGGEMIVPNTESNEKTRSVLEISTNCTAILTNTAQSLFTGS